MTDMLRKLNDEGVDQFRTYVQSLRSGQKEPPPLHLLTDPVASEPAPASIPVPNALPAAALADRFAFGSWLVNLLQPLQASGLVRDYGLWNWLSLKYFDHLCPASNGGRRWPRDPEAYVLDREFSYYSYYRHLVRTAWLAVALHQEHSKILLRPAGRDDGPPLAGSGEIVEQLASRQSLFGNRTLIEAAYRLYFDETEQRPRRGSGGSGAGSPRRLATVVQQLDLTYDLRECTTDQFLELLPKEFNRWKSVAEA